MAPESAAAGNVHSVQSKAVVDCLSLEGNDRDGALHLRERRLVDDLAGQQHAEEAVEIRDGRYQRSRRSYPGHVIDAVVAWRVDHAEPRLVDLRMRPVDMRPG